MIMVILLSLTSAKQFPFSFQQKLTVPNFDLFVCFVVVEMKLDEG